jgi:phosphate transport system substrate-binding protein
VKKVRFAALGSAIVLVLGVAACGDADRASLSGSIHIASSRTVARLTEAMAKRFMTENPKVRITVVAPEHGVEWRGITVANDATILVVDPTNPVRCLTTEQLSQIWQSNSEVIDNWRQVDDLDPPSDGGFIAFGPGTDTETFAWFTKAVNGVEGMTRDYNNVLHKSYLTIKFVAGNPGALGYVEYSLYKRHADLVRAIAVDSGDGCVAPSPETIADGTFRPLARRLFVSTSAKALARPATEAFLRYYLDNVESVAPRAGFVALTDEQLGESRSSLERLIADARDAS